MKKIGLSDVKLALKDGRFRDSLPESLKEDVITFLQNPTCPCNIPFYRKVIKEASDKLLEYFPDSELGESEADELKKLAQNQWQVINCHISELENKLRDLPPGRKQVAVCRYEDQITCVINELDLIF